LCELAVVLSYGWLRPRLVQLGVTSEEWGAYALNLVTVIGKDKTPAVGVMSESACVFGTIQVEWCCSRVLPAR
jgi:hypothetical protein